ncbi:hypothetical protein BBAL3_2181 [Brevundimonas sp. BAL3]|jgi:hypothetical protein|uniref:Uncharacterized protein n=1 Tax=Brevundimonas mediterranea TaxID=74329 RepID=A0A7Z8Y377_9CAUL|nr:hypothetical protein BBAL3_2181 [Brevundimonas sp. BAL3]VDC50037.1 hypothetical protein BREV_BREV_01687 [Brevundimonas mediterranea]
MMGEVLYIAHRLRRVLILVVPAAGLIWVGAAVHHYMG